ncbi:hypothetical protein [Roseiconus lacunae]|uniref:hypothetical protein n=1 Tax=Roseiconus lacunae TaxID=2605694 RepID=UPI001E48EC90|nr:hypothetical protein [Roseiconus lacunae]MCD0459882.1 hypothetical protein [Roseiconus lacunae]
MKSFLFSPNARLRFERQWQSLRSLQRLSLISAGLVLAVTGCNREERPVATGSGSVKADDKPVSGIIISLQPLPPTTGPKATAPVFNGKFEFGEQANLHGGKYRVRFTALPSSLLSQVPPESSEGIIAPGQSIHPDYDVNSTETWELKPGEENTADFEVEFQ